MNQQEFEVSIKDYLGIEGKVASKVPYRLGSGESTDINQDTVDLVFMLKEQGMMQKDIAEEMWVSSATVSKIVNERCSA